jgi:hypothetical protein
MLRKNGDGGRREAGIRAWNLSPEVTALLQDIFADQQRSQNGNSSLPEAAGLNALLVDVSENLPAVLQNLKLIHNTLGHQGAALRRVIEHSSTPEAHHLQTIYKVITSASREGTMDENPLGIIPDVLATVTDADDMYERLLFVQREPELQAAEYTEMLLHKTAAALGLPETASWSDIAGQFFSNPENLEKVLKNIGFIPQVVFSESAFKDLDQQAVGAFMTRLRKLEESSRAGDVDYRYERTRLTRAFVVHGRFGGGGKKRSNSAALDASGVRLDGPEFHAHIPFGLLTPDVIQTLGQQSLLSEQEILEANLRQANENTRLTSIDELDRKQLRAFAVEIGYDTKELKPEQIAEQLVKNPDEFAKTVVNKKLVIPDQVIDCLARDNQPAKIFALTRFAEAVAATLTSERLTRQPGLFSGYSLLHEHEAEYESRKALLHDPVYYNVVKTVQRVLEHPLVPQPENQFLVFRGNYRVSKGDQHAFFEVVHQGNVARVPISEHYVRRDQLPTWEALPVYEREDYEKLERVLRAYDYYSTTVKNLEKLCLTEAQDRKKAWSKRVFDLCLTAQAFVLMHATEYHKDVGRLVATLQSQADSPEVMQGTLQDMLVLLRKAQKKYADFLYQNTGSSKDFSEKFSPQISVYNLKFGPKFVEGAEESCPDGFDRELSGTDTEVRVVVVRSAPEDPTGLIPYYVEESAWEALRLDRKRPLINVIGGCRYVADLPDTDQHPQNRFALSVLKVAHTFKANVAIPATQSGTGIFFGRQAVNYRNQFGHLPKADVAHVFAVAPGGSTVFPGSELLLTEPIDHRFAITSVDALVLPFEAGFHKKGLDRLTSPHHDFIAYMESCYDRLAADQPRINVVGNGGLYSILELIGATRHGFKTMLLRDTGRFAEVMSMLFENRDTLPINGSAEELDIAILDLARDQLSPETVKEWCDKDFGHQTVAENDNATVYRLFFHEFLKLAVKEPESIQISTLEDLEKDLTASLTK